LTLVFRYTLLTPILILLTKSALSSIQSILHVLFLPTPFKVLAQAGLRSPAGSEQTTKKGNVKGTPIDNEVLEMPEEVLKPGALYAECAVVKLPLPVPEGAPSASNSNSAKGKEKEKRRDLTQDLVDDRELGGEATGRAVWEAYEVALSNWLKSDPIVEEPEAEADELKQTKAAGPETR
jgi:hypothetical protein